MTQFFMHSQIPEKQKQSLTENTEKGNKVLKLLSDSWFIRVL